MQAKADSIGQCMDLLFSPPKKDEAMPHAHEDTCSAKGSGKGTALRVPQLGEDNGPKWMYGGGFDGWKLWVGDLPSNISEADIGHYCDGQKHMWVLRYGPRSRIASALVTFVDLGRAMKAFEQLAMANFDHDGQMHRATVKWFNK